MSTWDSNPSGRILVHGHQLLLNSRELLRRRASTGLSAHPLRRRETRLGPCLQIFHFDLDLRRSALVGTAGIYRFGDLLLCLISLLAEIDGLDFAVNDRLSVLVFVDKSHQLVVSHVGGFVFCAGHCVKC